MNYGMVLRTFRLAKEYTIREIAKKMDVSPNYISEVETGKKMCSVDVLEKYSQALEVPLSSIIKVCELQNEKKWNYIRLMLAVTEILCGAKIFTMVDNNK